MADFLIDEEGNVWDNYHGRFQSLYGANCSSKAFIEYMVRNVGHIRVEATERTCTITAAPGRISIKAYHATVNLVQETGPKRVALNLFAGDWHHSIHPSPSSAFQSLIESACQVIDPSEQFLSKSKRLTSLDIGHPLRALLESWQSCSGAMNVDDNDQVIDGKLDRRFVLIEREKETSRLVFSRIGGGLQMYDRGWTRRLIGHRVEDQPDLEYAQWVANYWRNAYLADKPTLCDADVIVSNPREGTKRRIQYSRLTLPVRDSEGNLSLLSASLVDPSINLRVEVR